MKNNYPINYLKRVLYALLLFITASPIWSQVLSYTYNFTGAVQTITVPTCVTLISVDVRGAQGGTNSVGTVTGGLGGWVTGQMTVTPGDVLNIYVGGMNGYNGGGAAGVCSGCQQAGGGVGGGASDIRLNGTALSDRVVVAGGGGGGGGDRIPTCGRGAGGGGGGGYYGGGGGSGWAGSTAGGTVASGGTQVSGGTGGTSNYAVVNNGANGTLGVGGAGGGEVGSGQGTPQQPGYGAGGGGGATGQPGLGTFLASYWPGCGGAGGSSYLGTLTNASTTPAYNSGDGKVIISYNFGIPSLTISGTNGNICAGTNVTLTASGSTSYTWSTGAIAPSIVVSPTANTTYSVIGTTTAVCPPYGMLSTTVQPLPVVSAMSSLGTGTVCPGVQVTLSGVGADSYLWSNGISNGVAFPASATNTVYTVIGTNSTTGCSNSSTISVPVYPTAFTMSSPTTICQDVPVTLYANVQGGLGYYWSTNSPFQSITVSPSVTTVYGVTVTTSDFCTTSNTVLVTVLPKPNVSATLTRSVICRGESTTLNASGATTYTWSNAMVGQTITVNPLVTTSYTVTGSGANACMASAVLQQKVNVCVGLDELQASQFGLNLSPNPNNGNFKITSKTDLELQLISELGQVVRTLSLTDRNNHSVEITGLSQGVYFLKDSKGESMINQKILVNQ